LQNFADGGVTLLTDHTEDGLASATSPTAPPCFIAPALSHRGPHWLRHTFASLLLQQGESLVYVKEQMGYSSIQITVDTYGHLVPGGNRQAVDRLDDDGNILETFAKLQEEEQMQLIENIGATRRSRTGDLLITK
jgi:hypothetical protein